MSHNRRTAASLLASAALSAIAVTAAQAQTTTTVPSTTTAPSGGTSAQQPTESAAAGTVHAAATSQPTQAETAVQPGGDEDEDGEGDEIVVTGRRNPNAVIGDIPPENVLNSRDIRAYGAASVEELLTALEPLTGSSRGRGSGPPVVLLNGKRVSGFREVRDLPPEAILRVEIFPEEVALKYGYRADQRVVNFVLRRRFRSTTARAEAGLAAGGERRSGEVDVTRLMISQAGRTTLNFHAENANRVLESERNIAFNQVTPTSVDPRPFRTLLGDRRLVRGGGTINRTLFGDVSSTLDGQVEYSENESLLGPSFMNIGDPLAREGDTLSGHLGAAFNGQKDRWRWSLTGNYDVNRTTTETDRENDVPTLFDDRARSVSHAGELDLVANGPLVRVPAGVANVTIRTGAETRSLESRASRFGLITQSDLGRRELEASANIDVPIARRDDVLSALGNLTLNANAEIEQLSDFGTLTTYGAGFFWSPIERFNIITSFTREEGSPSLQQLGDPIIETSDVPIFDFVTGRFATVESVSGGNPNLDADRRKVFKVGMNTQPIEGTNLRFRTDYVRTRIDNPISGFPGASAALEAAFPDRFQRDASGNLIRVDFRPVNFDRSETSEISWGLYYSRPLTSARPSQAQLAAMRQRAGLPPLPQSPARGPGGGGEAGQGNRQGRGPGGGLRGGGGGGGPFGGGQQGRLWLSLNHTVLLKDEVHIRPALPVLDYLNGEPRGSSGTPQHRIRGNAGYFNNGLGAELQANIQSGSRVIGGRSGNLRFSPLARFNAEFTANLGDRLDLLVKYPWLRGTRVQLEIDNIFDARQRVRDDRNVVPPNYWPDRLDPQGRTIRFSIRKLFLPPPSFFRGQGGQGAGASGQGGDRQRSGAATGAPAPTTNSPPAPPTTGTSGTTSPPAPPTTGGTPPAN